MTRIDKRYRLLMKRILYFLLAVFSFGSVSAQQLPLFSQYVTNGFLVNPSLAGRDGYTSINFTVREQWLGMKGAPSTYVVNFQTSLMRNSFMSGSAHIRKKVTRPSKPSRVGIGGSLFNDNNGIMRRSGVKFDYSYHIPMGKSRTSENNLSFGLGLIMYQHAINTDNLNYTYEDDPYFSNYDRSVFITDFSFGTSYTTEKYYVGFSMTNILRGSLIFGDDNKLKRNEVGHFFLSGGANFPINKYWTVKPSAFIKSSDMVFKSMQVDLTTRVFYKDNYWGGLSYRTRDALTMLLGMRYDKFYIANSFDFGLTDIRKRSGGSYEVSLAVKFGESSRRYRWLNAY
jgi:type IX secretion system PorP/SprF family membrane protein